MASRTNTDLSDAAIESIFSVTESPCTKVIGTPSRLSDGSLWVTGVSDNQFYALYGAERSDMASTMHRLRMFDDTRWRKDESPCIAAHDLLQTNELRECSRIRFEDLNDGSAKRNADVREFLSQLRHRPDHVQTRIILMATPDMEDLSKMKRHYELRSQMEGRQQAAFLLQAHVLALELSLPVDLVIYLLADPSLGRWIYGDKPSHLLIRRAALSWRNPRFGCSYDAMYLERGTVGTMEPNLVIVRFCGGRNIPQVTTKLPDAALTSHNQSQSKNDMAYIRETSVSPLDQFVSMLGSELSPQTASSLSLDSVPGHWLAPLLQHSISHGLDVLSDYTTERDFRLFQGRTAIDIGLQLSTSLDSLLAQLSNLQAELPDLRIDDYLPQQQQLKRLAEEARSKALLSCQIAEGTAQATGVRMAQLSIEESRSAISLTILAFFFVPISLASSIFGMNVQEINQTGHGIWRFVVTSLSLLFVTMAAFCLWWRPSRNH